MMKRDVNVQTALVQIDDLRKATVTKALGMRKPTGETHAADEKR